MPWTDKWEIEEEVGSDYHRTVITFEVLHRGNVDVGGMSLKDITKLAKTEEISARFLETTHKEISKRCAHDFMELHSACPTSLDEE